MMFNSLSASVAFPIESSLVERQTSFQHEQKPVKIDDFNNEEEKIIKEQVKKKKKRREVTEENLKR